MSRSLALPARGRPAVPATASPRRCSDSFGSWPPACAAHGADRHSDPMNWLTNFVRPKLQALTRKPGTPDNLWEKCAKCEQMIFHRELEANLRVCPHCGHHFRVGWKRRLELLFDDGRYERVELAKNAVDPLK